MTSVFIWKGDGLTGHSSLMTDSKYLSFHPVNRDILTDLSPVNSPGEMWNRADDINVTGQRVNPVGDYDIEWLDNSAINPFIDQLWQNTPTYNLYGRNCSSLVAEALMRGAGIHGNIMALAQEMWLNVKSKIGHDRDFVVDHIQDTIDTSLMAFGRRSMASTPVTRFFYLVFAGTDAGIRTFTWTPSAIRVLASELEKHRL